MRTIIGICAFLLIASSAASFAQVRIQASSFKNRADLALNPSDGSLKNPITSSSFVTTTDHFTIRDGTLFHNGEPSFKAAEVLAQGASDGTDIVVVRIETLGLGNPLAFLAGHPKQVSKIVVAGFRNGRVAWQHRIAKETYSGKWQASITSGEV
jgi:hypothetical protein